MKLYGFYLRLFGKDCFFETNQKRITNTLVTKFLDKVEDRLWNSHSEEYNDEVIKHFKMAMRAATFEMKTIEKGSFAGLRYYEINGENFSYGCDPCSNPEEHYILVY